MNNIAILGTSGLAGEVAFLIGDINRGQPDAVWKLIGFVGPADGHTAAAQKRIPIVGDDNELLARRSDTHVALGVGDPKLRRILHQRFKANARLRFPNLVHPNVVWERDSATIGEGNIICAGCVLTTDVAIGDGNYVNLTCTVGHEVIIGDYCVINPGANISGRVRICDACLIGTGATILQGITIGKNACVGAGAVVTKDVPPDATVVGVPAKVVGRAG